MPREAAGVPRDPGQGLRADAGGPAARPVDGRSPARMDRRTRGGDRGQGPRSRLLAAVAGWRERRRGVGYRCGRISRSGNGRRREGARDLRCHRGRRRNLRGDWRRRSRRDHGRRSREREARDRETGRACVDDGSAEARRADRAGSGGLATKGAEPSSSPPTPVQQKSRQFGVESPPASSSSGSSSSGEFGGPSSGGGGSRRRRWWIRRRVRDRVRVARRDSNARSLGQATTAVEEEAVKVTSNRWQWRRLVRIFLAAAVASAALAALAPAGARANYNVRECNSSVGNVDAATIRPVRGATKISQTDTCGNWGLRMEANGQSTNEHLCRLAVECAVRNDLQDRADDPPLLHARRLRPDDQAAVGRPGTARSAAGATSGWSRCKATRPSMRSTSSASLIHARAPRRSRTSPTSMRMFRISRHPQSVLRASFSMAAW